MIVRIPALLRASEVATIQTKLADARWDDGRVTAGHQSGRVKHNLQLGSDSPLGAELGRMVVQALEASPLFLSSALPRHVFPPLFNRYEPGMTFGGHFDNAVRQVAGTAHRIRTDLSATLFLSDPNDYAGGELVVEDTYGEHRIKAAAGDAVLYSARSIHRIDPVTKGRRIASFFWVQSLVRHDDHREMLFELDRSIQQLSAGQEDAPAILRLSALYHNLLREWAEM